MSRKGFTLIELVVMLGLSFAITAGLLTLMTSVFKLTNPTFVQVSCPTGYSNLGSSSTIRRYPKAPSYWVFSQAVTLHASLQVELTRADAVFVLGGSRANPVVIRKVGAEVDESAVTLPPMSMDFLPSVLAIPNGMDLRLLRSGFDVWSIGALVTEISYDPVDFTVITVRGLTSVSSITQVRRKVVEGNVLYDVYFFNSTSLATNNKYPTLNYGFSMPLAQETIWSVPLGARHYWYRYDGVTINSEKDTSWNRREPGPVRLLFPDPYIVKQSNSSIVKLGSRFSYFVNGVK
jgi:hypothetical protein